MSSTETSATPVEGARIGVIGAGTMGAGIAQLACLGGFHSRLIDSDGASLDAGRARALDGLAKGVKRGLWGETAADEAATLLDVGDGPDAASGCGLVIEAVPESLSLKRQVFASLESACRSDAVLCTNTSSLSVSAIASRLLRPERVVGMHFFNPAPLMRLVEIVAGERSNDRSLTFARGVAHRMGKTTIDVKDAPGFAVNRGARPFYGEAMRLVHEGVADVETVDRIVRSAGFPMGPFEVMDLVGLDVSLAVARSFYEQSFQEPRWRPSMLQASRVHAGLLGRKSGRGFYDYGDGKHRPDDPPPLAAGRGDASVAIVGRSALADDLAAAASACGFRVTDAAAAAAGKADLIVEAAPGALGAEVRDAVDVPTARLVADSSLSISAPKTEAVGWHALPPLAGTLTVELTRGRRSSERDAQAAESFFTTLGKRVEWVADAPGLVLGRIVCGLVNEAHFAQLDGVASPADFDMGMRVGLSHPRGPHEWERAIGARHVLAVLDGLANELREERYRAAPSLRRRAAFAGP